ncbi:MAG: hypothetical protein ACREOO_26740 [bacterium]
MKTTKRKPNPIGHQLVRALTKDQVADVLTAIFDLIDDQKLNALSLNVDKDLATTLSRIVSTKTKDTKRPTLKRIVSDQKYIEEWDELWSAWGEVALEAGEEEGKYIYQEHHWEAPYFAGDTLAEDLDRIAEKMLPRLERIYALGTADANIFVEGIQEIGSCIYDLPEWMGADHEGFCLGPAATRCVLKWEWLVASSKARPSPAFVERILAIEDSSELVDLDGSAMVEFFLALPEKPQRQIHEYLTANRVNAKWQEKLRSARSKWHQIYQAFSESFNPAMFLENCLAALHENWRYGLPLVENLLKKKEYMEAAAVIEQTFSSRLHYRANMSWRPEESLLIDFMRYAYDAPEKEIIKLLKHWIVIAERISQTERVAALKLQRVTYEKPHQWQAVIEVYKELRELPYANMMARLFSQWQAFILGHSVDATEETRKAMSDSWIHWLIETGVDEAKDERWFAQKVHAWLEHLCQNPAEFKKHHLLVYTLTLDLAQESSLKKDYPKLFRFVLGDIYVNRESAPARRAWLEKMQGKKFIPRLMKCWTQNIAMLVPDPARAHQSAYQEHAEWLAVVNELNPTACRAMINKWRVDHKKRKNLWLAIKEQHLPG